VDEDLLVLLVPGVDGIPLETRPAVQPEACVAAVDAQRRRPGHLAHRQSVAAGSAPAQLLLMPPVDENNRVDVAMGM
jgi:hypothetical protein